MKKLITLLCCILGSGAVLADKVVITGEPVVLEQRGDVYTVPANYTATTSYHYVTIAGTNRVCYPEQQPALAGLDTKVVNIEVGGQQVQWVCYLYDDAHFQMTNP